MQRERSLDVLVVRPIGTVGVTVPVIVCANSFARDFFGEVLGTVVRPIGTVDPPYQWSSASLEFLRSSRWLSPRIGTVTQYGRVPVLVVVKNPNDKT